MRPPATHHVKPTQDDVLVLQAYNCVYVSEGQVIWNTSDAWVIRDGVEVEFQAEATPVKDPVEDSAVRPAEASQLQAKVKQLEVALAEKDQALTAANQTLVAKEQELQVALAQAMTEENRFKAMEAGYAMHVLDPTGQEAGSEEGSEEWVFLQWMMQ